MWASEGARGLTVQGLFYPGHKVVLVAVELWHLGGPAFPAEDCIHEVASPLPVSLSSAGKRGIHRVQLSPEVVPFVGFQVRCLWGYRPWVSSMFERDETDRGNCSLTPWGLDSFMCEGPCWISSGVKSGGRLSRKLSNVTEGLGSGRALGTVYTGIFLKHVCKPLQPMM